MQRKEWEELLDKYNVEEEDEGFDFSKVKKLSDFKNALDSFRLKNK